MEKILMILSAQNQRNGKLKLSTLKRMLSYNRMHPMWSCMATEAHLNAFRAFATLATIYQVKA